VKRDDGGALDLPLRLRRAGLALAYIVAGVPLGLLGLLTALAVAAGTIVTPLLPAAVGAGRWVAEQERRAANALLNAHIPPLAGPPHGVRGPDDVRRDRQLKRMLAFPAIKLPIALLALALAALFTIATVGLLALGVKGIAGIGEPTYVGPVETGFLPGVAKCLLALPVAVLGLAALGALRSMFRSLARALLLAPPAPAGAPVREMLAESLGDRSLSIAYWLPDREIFVDEAGRTVTLPESGSRRAWTAVERDGRRVAAIVHDAELHTGPELVQAAAAAAALALDNERLKAELRARVEELRVSRVRIVEAADAARRRLERDLHDGAQQHLVSLAIDLRVLKACAGDPEFAALVDEISAKLATGLAELRELARGIHPAVLTERGLGPALESLAERTPIPVESQVDVGSERLAAPIEAAAYFVVSEALTNVVRYAQADSALVEIRRVGDDVVVDVRDDGVGGADISSGSGLRGLADRLSALDGELRVVSPPGGGTLVEGRIPCAAGELVEEAREADPGTEASAPPPSAVETPR
jgi:signal transduction histidine kinase